MKNEFFKEQNSILDPERTPDQGEKALSKTRRIVPKEVVPDEFPEVKPRVPPDPEKENSISYNSLTKTSKKMFV